MQLRASFVSALLILVITFSTAHAQLYWDVNGATGGAGDGNGTWDGANTNWSTDEPGTISATWVPGSAAVFAASNDASGSYTVTVDGTQSASGLTFEDGFPTLVGGQVDLTGAGTVNVPSLSGFATINSVIGGSVGMNATGTGVLRLGGANTYSGATTIGSATEGIEVQLLAAERIPDTSVLTLVNGNLNTEFNLNGFNETVRSIATTGAAPIATIILGASTLTINDQLGDVNTYVGNFSASGGKVIKNGGGTLIINSNVTSGFASGVIEVNDGVFGIGQNNSIGTYAANSTLTINQANNSPGPTIRKSTTGAPGSNWSVRNININGSFTMDMNGATNVQTVGGASGTADTGNVDITLGAENPTITVMSSAVGNIGAFIFAGRVRNGAGVTNRGFTKAGPGLLILGHKDNDYRGATTIQEGTLRVTNQFFNALSTANNGAAKIGDGTGAVNLSGGTLQYNGSPSLNATFTAADGPRTMTVTNPINVTADSTINYLSTTLNLGATNTIDFIFTNPSITGTGGTLAFRHEGSCTDNGGVCNFQPTFSGNGFNFSRPVSVNNHTTAATRATVLRSTNDSGTQTWSGIISGDGSLRRSVAGGTTVLTAANTYSGGTTVDGGSLNVSGASATLGTGNVTVTGGTLGVAAGVANAIANTAMLSISGTGIVNLGAGINDLIAALSLGGVPQTTGGTYGSVASGAMFTSAFFSGTGVVTIPAVGQPGDYNEDDIVDAADYVYWRKRNPDPTGPALPNDDSAGVNNDDYDRWVANFGEPGGGGGGVNGVPEPGTFVLALIAVLATSGLNRRRR